jgi:hypothetical protein
MSTTNSFKIKKGTKFRAVIADSNPEWEVISKAGQGVWRAKCLELDSRDTIHAFTEEQILQSIGWANDLAKNADENGQFYAGLTLGSVVHYHHSFGEFVRCEVVMGTTAFDKKTHKCLKPIALVGEWKGHDLTRRLPDGTIHSGYHATCVLKGECFKPHYGLVYESGQPGGKHFNVDPSKLPALDLSVPAPTPEEAKTAKLWTAMKEAQAALESEDDYNRGPRERLEAALKAIQGAL